MRFTKAFIFPEMYRSIAEEYIAYKQSLGFAFPYMDQKKLNSILKFLYEASPYHSVTDLDEAIVRKYLDQYQGKKPRTLHANQSFIRQYGLFLKRKGLDPFIFPSDLVRCNKDFSPYIFTKDEISKILFCADRIGPNKNKFVNTPYIYPAMIRLLYGCGSRIGETVSLKIEDVDLSEGIVFFYSGKNNVSRIVPMSVSLTNYLRKYEEKVDRTGNNYFFPALKGECYAPLTIRNAFRKLLKQANIPKLSTGKYPRLHDLRHTFAVHSLEHSIDQGFDPYCSLPALSTFLGHKGVESTEYYLRLAKQYFINILNYTQPQADLIFPEI
jgi:integrase